MVINKDFKVALADDGTLDTVMVVRSKLGMTTTRFNHEFASEFRNEYGVTPSGFQELGVMAVEDHIEQLAEGLGMEEP